MKSLTFVVLALQGVSAFPSVLESVAKRATVGQSGCTTSAKCNRQYAVSDSQVGYDANNPTAAQKIQAGIDNCGVLCPCTTFNAAEQKGTPK